MKIFYFKHPDHNFGDDLNEWMWNRLAPGRWDQDDSHLFSAIGTIIGPLMTPYINRQWTVFGSGTGYGSVPAGFGGPNWNVVCVRGPLTASFLGLDRRMAVCDGAILLRRLPEFAPIPESERSGVSFMPHHDALHRGDWKAACERAGIQYISPQEDSVSTVDKIRRSKLMIADAMHSAIVADAMRVPWVPVMTSPGISTFKWLDWTMSLGLPYRPMKLVASTPIEASRNLASVLAGDVQVFEAPDAASAVEKYRQIDNRAKSTAAMVRRNWGLRMFRYALEPLATSKLRRCVDPGGGERQLDKSAERLSAVTREASYLSDDRRFDAALSELSARFDTWVSK